MSRRANNSECFCQSCPVHSPPQAEPKLATKQDTHEDTFMFCHFPLSFFANAPNTVAAASFHLTFCTSTLRRFTGLTVRIFIHAVTFGESQGWTGWLGGWCWFHHWLREGWGCSIVLLHELGRFLAWFFFWLGRVFKSTWLSFYPFWVFRWNFYS